MSSGSIENRKAPRIEVCLTAHFEGVAAEVRISDLSEGGCYVDTIAEVVVGEGILLNILHDGEWFKLSGLIAHHFPRLGFGVRFVNLDSKQTAWIRSVIHPGSQEAEQFPTGNEDEFWFSPDQLDLTHQPVM